MMVFILSSKGFAMAKKKPIFETPHILHDLPLARSDQAHFHFDEFAVTLARLIADKETRTPLTIGISGAWGSGKTTLLRRLQRQLDQTVVLLDPTKPALLDFVNEDEVPQKRFRACRTVWFNAWKYADEEQLLVALVRVIVQEMFKDDFVSKSAAVLLEPFTPRRDVINTVLGWFSIKVGDVGVGVNTGDPKPTPFAEKTAMLDLFDEAFDKLMAAWVHRKLNVDKIDPAKGVLVIFIDDLDRCLPEKTVQVLEAAKLFLDKPGCVFVLGAHTEVVQQAVASHYKDSGVVGESAREYLEKIIQLRFDLPPIVTDTMKGYLTAEKVEAELQKHWQVLVTGAELNPRKVKTFVNDLNLQWAILQNTGQAEGVVRDDFTRWQVLMRAAPDEFKKRIFDIDDLELRLKFVQDALKWGGGKGEEAVNKVFQEYEKFMRLRRVLREIKAFSGTFDSVTLDAFAHLEAPPQKPVASAVEPPVEKPEEKMAEAEAAPEAFIRKEDRLRGMPAEPKRAAEEAVSFAEKGAAVAENHITIGGLEFIKIPAGKFIMGSKDDNSLAQDREKPQHTVELPDFLMAKFPLTNEQYAAYPGNKEHPVKDWKDKKNHPVVNVSWNDAMAYCKWFNETHADELKKRAITLHLPTEAQWEKAARGEYGNEWPWGNEFDPKKCNADEGRKGGTTPVDAYPQGESPYGVADMVGNVWEWTHTLFKGYPYEADKSREDEKASGSRVLRGGSWSSDRNVARCAYRYISLPDNHNYSIGFRVCVSPIS
jgi:formylglycine-generating enzyme required for sulfatase activity